jgi:hypothetical protein
VTRRANRRERSWAQVAQIVGPGVYDLPDFFKNGLYSLARAGLPDSEIVLAFKRCRAWIKTAMKNGYGECECDCGTELPVDAANAQNISVWNLDHDNRTKTFRGILFQKCNRQMGSGDRARKWAHYGYIEAHEARLRQNEGDVVVRDEFQKPGAMPD